MVSGEAAGGGDEHRLPRVRKAGAEVDEQLVVGGVEAVGSERPAPRVGAASGGGGASVEQVGPVDSCGFQVGPRAEQGDEGGWERGGAGDRQRMVAEIDGRAAAVIWLRFQRRAALVTARSVRWRPRRRGGRARGLGAGWSTAKPVEGNGLARVRPGLVSPVAAGWTLGLTVTRSTARRSGRPARLARDLLARGRRSR